MITGNFTKLSAPFLIILFLLAGCNGGASDGEPVVITDPTDTDDGTEASKLYQGKTDPTLLNKGNTLQFIDRLKKSYFFIPEELYDYTYCIHSSDSDPELPHPLPMTEDCFYGGTINADGSGDENDDLAVVQYQLSDCKPTPSVIINGVISQETFTYRICSSPTSHIERTYEFKNLSVTINDETFIETGTIEYLMHSGANGGYRQEKVMNKFSYSPTTLKQYLVEDFESYTKNGSMSISGKVYIDSEGYVTASYNGVNKLYQNLPVYTAESSFITGASNSQARVSPKGSIDVIYDYPKPISYIIESYLIELDREGDGSFEIYSIQDDIGTPPLFVENNAPTAIIDVNNENIFSPNTEPTFTHHDTVYLFANRSNDPEGDDISFKWTVEERPVGSVVEFGEPVDTEENWFKPDLAGVYKFSLKTTDKTGSGESAIAFKTIDVTNSIPVVELLTFAQPNYATTTQTYAEVGHPMSIDIAVSDEDDSYSQDQASSNTWGLKLKNKPEGSSATFTTTDTAYSQNIYYIRNKFTPDIPGFYTFSFWTADTVGAIDTKTLTFNVKNTSPIAKILCIECTLGQLNADHIPVGTSIMLSAKDSQEPIGAGFKSNLGLTYEWEVESTPPVVWS